MGHTSTKHITTPPGGVIVWFVIIMEMITFIAGICFYFSYKQDNYDLFIEMQSKLSLTFAILNTLILVTSGYLVAMAVNFLKHDQRAKSRHFLLGGVVVGSFFTILKLVEYSQKIDQGLTSDYNTFFTFYWFLTFFHFAHVLFTTLILIFFYFKIKKKSESEVEALEVGASLWHMCDLIWILLFPALYLIR